MCFVCVRGSRAEWGPGDHSKADLFSPITQQPSLMGDWHTPVILSGTERREGGRERHVMGGITKRGRGTAQVTEQNREILSQTRM